MSVTKNVFCYVAIALISVLYVLDSRQGVPSMQKGYMLYALKFVKHVLKNAANILLIMQVVKNVQKPVKNVQKFAQSFPEFWHNQNVWGLNTPLLIHFLKIHFFT